MNSNNVVELDDYENSDIFILTYADESNPETGIDCVHFFSMDEVQEYVDLHCISYYSVEVV